MSRSNTPQISDKTTARARRRRRAGTLALATAGTIAFYLAGLPLPFLFGPMLACLVAALFGAKLLGAGQVSVASRTILGVAIGGAITPELLMRIPQMLGSVALVPVYIAIICVIGVPFFHRLCGFDRITAYYAAMPGGLQDMVIFGQEAGGNARTLSLVHATRVLIIVTLAPPIITHGFDMSLDAPIGEPTSAIPLHELGIMAIAALGGWKLGERVGLFGATILGPLIATALLSLTGIIHHRPPAEAILLAQFFVGISIGVGYVGVTLHELRRDVLSGVFYVVILAALALIFTEIVVMAGIAPPLDAFLAFSPGGQAEMTILALISGADLGFVVMHHMVRVILVITGAPLVARILRLRD